MRCRQALSSSSICTNTCCLNSKISATSPLDTLTSSCCRQLRHACSQVTAVLRLNESIHMGIISSRTDTSASVTTHYIFYGDVTMPQLNQPVKGEPRGCTQQRDRCLNSCSSGRAWNRPYVFAVRNRKRRCNSALGGSLLIAPQQVCISRGHHRPKPCRVCVVAAAHCIILYLALTSVDSASIGLCSCGCDKHLRHWC